MKNSVYIGLTVFCPNKYLVTYIEIDKIGSFNNLTEFLSIDCQIRANFIAPGPQSSSSRTVPFILMGKSQNVSDYCG